MGPSTSFAATATMREHVEIAYPAELESQPFKVGNMNTEGCTTKQLSLDKESGEGTEEVECPEGWTTEIGHFNHDMECFVLEGDLDIGGFSLHKYSYTFVPAGIAVGPFKAVTKCKLLWMPFGYLEYSTEDYKGLTQKGASTLHKNTLDHPRYGEYIPCVDTPSMPWKQTSLLPPGSARKSLRGTVDGPSSWILGLVPQWIEGNFLASHPTSEETYTLEGAIGRSTILTTASKAAWTASTPRRARSPSTAQNKRLISVVVLDGAQPRVRRAQKKAPREGRP